MGLGFCVSPRTLAASLEISLKRSRAPIQCLPPRLRRVRDAPRRSSARLAQLHRPAAPRVADPADRRRRPLSRKSRRLSALHQGRAARGRHRLRHRPRRRRDIAAARRRRNSLQAAPDALARRARLARRRRRQRIFRAPAVRRPRHRRRDRLLLLRAPPVRRRDRAHRRAHPRHHLPVPASRDRRPRRYDADLLHGSRVLRIYFHGRGIDAPADAALRRDRARRFDQGSHRPDSAGPRRLDLDCSRKALAPSAANESRARRARGAGARRRMVRRGAARRRLRFFPQADSRRKPAPLRRRRRFPRGPHPPLLLHGARALRRLPAVDLPAADRRRSGRARAARASIRASNTSSSGSPLC